MKRSFPLTMTAVGALVALCGCTKYYSKTTMEYRSGPASSAADEAAIRALLPTDPAVTLHEIKGTGLFEIGVYDRDPETAARRANDLTIAVRDGLRHKPRGLEVKIWLLAEPPQKRQWPWQKP